MHPYNCCYRAGCCSVLDILWGEGGRWELRWNLFCASVMVGYIFRIHATSAGISIICNQKHCVLWVLCTNYGYSRKCEALCTWSDAATDLCHLGISKFLGGIRNCQLLGEIGFKAFKRLNSRRYIERSFHQKCTIRASHFTLPLSSLLKFHEKRIKAKFWNSNSTTKLIIESAETLSKVFSRKIY